MIVSNADKEGEEAADELGIPLHDQVRILSAAVDPSDNHIRIFILIQLRLSGEKLEIPQCGH